MNQVDSNNGYLSNIDLPQNPYSKDFKSDRALTYGEQHRQFAADLGMAQYNAQIAENQMLMSRAWALEDRENERSYSSPAAQRKRLEEAGYNPALLAGQVQSTVNPPTRGVNPSPSNASASNTAGVSARVGANIIEAGKSLISSMQVGKQVQLMDSQIALQRAAAVKELSQASHTDSARRRIDELVLHEKQALEIQNQRNQFEFNLDKQYKEDQIRSQLKDLKSSTNLRTEQALTEHIRRAEMESATELNKARVGESKAYQRLTDAQISQIAKSIEFTDSQIEYIATQIAIGNERAAQEVVETQVAKATKYANIAGGYVGIISQAIGSFLGIRKAFIPTQESVHETMYDKSGRVSGSRTRETYRD